MLACCLLAPKNGPEGDTDILPYNYMGLHKYAILSFINSKSHAICGSEKEIKLCHQWPFQFPLKLVKENGQKDVDLLLGQPLTRTHALSGAEGANQTSGRGFAVFQPAFRQKLQGILKVFLLQRSDPLMAKYH